MGQYYRPVLEQNGKITVYNRDIDGDYTLAKIMEHSWWYNPLMNAVSEKMYQNPSKLIWCGDYAEDEEIEMTGKKIKNIWGIKGKGLNSTDFRVDNLYLCNHDLQEYIDMNKYKEESEDDGWTIHPLSLLTAIGNGRGGGDYWGINEDSVRIWAWNKLSFESDIPENYVEFDIVFKE